jgi:hypothetical protein
MSLAATRFLDLTTSLKKNRCRASNHWKLPECRGRFHRVRPTCYPE